MLSGFTVCVLAGALISTDGVATASANVTGADGIANAVSIDMSVQGAGDTATFFQQVSNASATADDDAADSQLTSSAGLAQHTVWYKFHPAPGQVTVTVSSSIPSIVAGVVTTSAADSAIDGLNDTFNLVTEPSVINGDGDPDDAGSALVHSPSAGASETFTFTADAALVANAQHDYYLGVGSVGADSTAPDGVINVSTSYTSAPINDDFADAAVITPSVKTYTGDTTGATPDLAADGSNVDPMVAGQPGMFSVWYSFTAPRNGRVNVSTAGSTFPVVFEVCQSPVVVASDCDNTDIVDSGLAGTTPITSTSFDALDGQTYYVFLDGQQVSGQAYNAFGAYTLGFTFLPSATNDDISTPTVLSPTGVDRVTGSNVGAQAVVLGSDPPSSITEESDAGLLFDGGGQQHSVWYRYKPNKTGQTVLYTTGSLNTDVEVFRGSLAAGFTDTNLGNDNYSAHQTFSRFTLPVRAGTIYYIGVDGSTTANYPEGSFGLDLGAVPANDTVKAATFLAKTKITIKVGKKKKKKKLTVSKKSGKVKGSTDFATFQAGEKSPKHFTGNADVWYTFVAPKAGHYTFTESLSHAAGLLAAYSGKGTSNLGLKLVTAASHAGTTKPASIRIKAKRGQKFTISVDGSAGAFGGYTLTWK
jgi:hypothetical protein